MDIAAQKQSLRSHLARMRQQLPSQRRRDAANTVRDKVLALSGAHTRISSFSSFGHEIDTFKLNVALAHMGKLVLPRVTESDSLAFFHVEHLDGQLAPSSWGIMEPIPGICSPVNVEDLTLVLVPGYGFDLRHHRLGYGTGLYDRFLASLPASTRKIGIGFHEQMVPYSLPDEPHDICLDDLILG